MLNNYKNNFIGYFRFFYSVVGNKPLLSVLISMAVSVLDNIGLAMLIPLLQSVAGEEQSTKHSMGYLHFITDTITKLGFPLTLGTVLTTLAILFSLKGLVGFFGYNYQAKVMHYFMKKVRHELVHGLQGISYKGFTHLDAGNLQNSFIAEVQRMSMAVRSYLISSQHLLMLTTYIAFALLSNYQFAILLTVGAGLTNLLYSRIYKKVKKASYEISKKGDNFNAYMIQAVHYFKYLKSTNYFGIYAKKLREVINNTENLNRKVGYYDAISTGIKEPTILLIVVIVIYLQLNWLGGNLGSIILSLLLFYRALNFLIFLQTEWQNFIQRTGSLRSVANISATMNTMRETYGTKGLNSIRKEILVSNVSMSYGSNKVLDQVNILIPKRQTVAFVGESGSGKTTIANIIMGLIIPDSGTVMVDNVPLSEYNLDSYRSKIGYISQDSVIFNDNIYNNVTFWAEPTQENYSRFWKVIELVSLKEYVESQTDRELTQLGDYGLLISGGQKQRISIAREIFKNAEILILDEATSALDSETELIIQDNIEKLHGHYTMIIIAHRLSTIKNADQIYLLEKGKVTNSGNFESMVKNSEKFKRMVSLQGL